MSHYTPDVDFMGFVAHPSNQSILVVADIEDRTVTINISAAKSRTHLRKALPVSVARDVIPGVKRHLALRMEFVELPDLFVRYNSHSLPPGKLLILVLFIIPSLSLVQVNVEPTAGSHIGNLLSRV
jgi:hypothetical protein